MTPYPPMQAPAGAPPGAAPGPSGGGATPEPPAIDLSKAQTEFDTLPRTRSLVGDAEEFVRQASHRMVSAANTLGEELVGKTGRPFGHVSLTGEEAYTKYKMMRASDDPQVWSAELQSAGGEAAQKALLRRWKADEERYQTENGMTLSKDERSVLRDMQPPEAPR